MEEHGLPDHEVVWGLYPVNAGINWEDFERGFGRMILDGLTGVIEIMIDVRSSVGAACL
jgi:hypothetical protein